MTTAEQVFSYQFQSGFITLVIFAVLILVGAGLGFVFWLDFRRRGTRAWRNAGIVVMLAGALIGAGFGYRATQPEYFKAITANEDGVRLEYHHFTDDVLLRWPDIDGFSIQGDRLFIEAGQAGSYSSAVVHRPQQQRLLRSLRRLMPANDP